MEFTLRTPEGFIGRIYTYGYYDRCFFRGNGGTVNVLRISGPQGYPECGTQRVRHLFLFPSKERRNIYFIDKFIGSLGQKYLKKKAALESKVQLSLLIKKKVNKCSVKYLTIAMSIDTIAVWRHNDQYCCGTILGLRADRKGQTFQSHLSISRPWRSCRHIRLHRCRVCQVISIERPWLAPGAFN